MSGIVSFPSLLFRGKKISKLHGIGIVRYHPVYTMYFLPRDAVL